MSFKPTNKIITWYYYVIIVVILIVGSLATLYTYKSTAENTQRTLLKDVASLSVTFDVEDIASLTGSESDLSNPGKNTHSKS